MPSSILLSAAILSPANITDVTQRGLFYPADPKAGHELLFGHDQNGTPRAIIVGEDREFGYVDPTKTGGSKGVFVQDVQIEVHPAAAFDAEHLYSPFGAVIRSADKLLIIARGHNQHGFAESREMVLVDDLPVLSSGLQIGFYEWSIVIGSGSEKQMLKTFRLEPADGPPR